MGRFFGTAALMFHFILVLFGTADGRAGEITDALKSRIALLGASELIPVIVSFADGTDPFASRQRSSTSGGMIRDLQVALGQKFEWVRYRFGGEWPAVPIERFWINQTVAMDATREMIERLADRKSVV